MDITDLKYNRLGGIDCTIDHPLYGLIPYTVPETDEDEIAMAVRAAIAYIDPATIPAYVKSTDELMTEIKAQRDSDLQQIVYTFADGRVVQVRPQDLANFQLAIDRGQDQKWILADNSVSLLTVAEMAEALADGIAQGEAIWQTCTTALEAL